jgi:WD40 repeat protein
MSITPGMIMCGTSESVVHVWDSATLEELGTLEGHEGTVYSLASMTETFGRASVLFSASFDSTIKVWDLETLACLQTLRRHEDSTNSLTVTQDWLFSGAADNTIKVWSRD